MFGLEPFRDAWHDHPVAVSYTRLILELGDRTGSGYFHVVFPTVPYEDRDVHHSGRLHVRIIDPGHKMSQSDPGFPDFSDAERFPDVSFERYRREIGVSVERSRLMMMLVAVVLTAAATALAGPISFIALVAPHIARRLSGSSRWGLTLSALCGALLLLMADLCAQQLFMPYQLPVGVVTVSLGGIYLIVLLIQESRKK